MTTITLTKVPKKRDNCWEWTCPNCCTQNISLDGNPTYVRCQGCEYIFKVTK